MANLIVLFLNIMLILAKILFKFIRFTGLYIAIFTFIIGYNIAIHIGATFGSTYDYIFTIVFFLSLIPSLFITVHNFKKLLGY